MVLVQPAGSAHGHGHDHGKVKKHDRTGVPTHKAKNEFADHIQNELDEYKTERGTPSSFSKTVVLSRVRIPFFSLACILSTCNLI